MTSAASLASIVAEVCDPAGPVRGRVHGFRDQDLVIPVASRAALVELAGSRGARLHPSGRHHTHLIAAHNAVEVYSDVIPVRTIAVGLAGALLDWEVHLQAGHDLLGRAFPDLAEQRSLRTVLEAKPGRHTLDVMAAALNSAAHRVIMGSALEYAADPAPAGKAAETLAVLLEPHLGRDVPFGAAGGRIAAAARCAVDHMDLAAGALRSERLDAARDVTVHQPVREPEHIRMTLTRLERDRGWLR